VLRVPILVLAAWSASSGAPQESRVHWKGVSYPAEALPEAAGEAARATAGAWAEWAAKSRYRLDLSDDARVLLATPASGASVRGASTLVERAEVLFDRLLPAPDRSQEPAAAPAPEPSGRQGPPPGELPEDPEEGPAGLTPRVEPRAATETSWGTETRALDSATAVMFVLRDEAEYRWMLERLGEQHEYLRPWIARAGEYTGFVLEQPLAGAFVMSAQGQEEWDARNELVNRVVQLLLLRRFGQEPHWLVQGTAWHVERELLGAIYCFPYRDEFVFAVEHTSWSNDLKRTFLERADAPVDLRELTDWRRGTYRGPAARLAWGLVSWCAQRRARHLPEFLEALRRFRDADNRQAKEDGTWTRDTEYVVPAEAQERILREILGATALEEAAAWFRAGLPAGSEGGR